MSSSVDVTHKFDDQLDVELMGIPTDFDFDLSGIPSDFTFAVTDLPSIRIEPLEVSLAITRIPAIRTHVPSTYTIGFSVLGYELMALRVCGETQLITEPFRPNPCEICGQIHREPGGLHVAEPVAEVASARSTK
jgi:hypothetical protein